MNRYSRVVTKPKDQGASQAMLYATDGITNDDDFDKAMVGVASVCCNKHILGLGQDIKSSLKDAGLIGYQFGTVGVSDGISMGTPGMSYSLQSRDLIADQVETAAGGHHLDAMIVVPGCDKNMPGVLMALGRLNRPGLMVYGGSIRPGSCEGAPQLDIVSAFQSYGKYLQDGQTDAAEKTRYNTNRHACPGPGACGGMYTANTMASASEALGMALPGSSSYPAESQEKRAECASVGPAMYDLISKNILPRDIMTRSAFENAMVLTMILGGSTNAVLHLIAIAHSVGIKLTIDDFQAVSDRTPFIADIKPSGKYVMEDVYRIGGIPKILAFLLKNKLIDGNGMTVTGKTLGENLEEWTHKHGELDFRQDVIRPLENPIKSTGHLRILRGNLAPGGAVAKITGKEGLGFTGKARVFDSEDAFVKAVETKSIKQGEKTVVILRYLGPKGGPGASRWPIAFVRDGDVISVDAVKNTIELRVSDEEMAERRKGWVAPPLKVKQGTLYKYVKVVEDASHGCITDA
ncbi:dihydroxy-acid and 6-phosphogluconate dehydratase [Hymenopellis radicata]|nr:dihydroxy-acid and 6-phosphogluconate dehydratase [Hymenopellis radicata]